jgi:hypothetical protein
MAVLESTLDLLMLSTYLAAAANIALLLAILYPSTVNFLKTRSSVPTLLMAFSIVFLVQNVVAIYFHMTTPYTTAVELEVMVLTVLQTVGFGALAWVTYR